MVTENYIFFICLHSLLFRDCQEFSRQIGASMSAAMSAGTVGARTCNPLFVLALALVVGFSTCDHA